MDFGQDLQISVGEYDKVSCKSELGHNFMFNPESVESRYPNHSDINSSKYFGGKSEFKLKNLWLFKMIPIV